MNILITAGGTSEPIDNVRKITNTSTGKLGLQILTKLIQKDEIETIFYITSNHSLKPKDNDKVKLIIANSTKDVQEALVKTLSTQKIDYVIHSMAISDYTTKAILDIDKLSETLAKNIGSKIIDEDSIKTMIKNSLLDTEFEIDRKNKVSSSNENMFISLEKTPKVINIIKEISPETKLIGFKLLSNSSKKDLETAAMKVIENSDADYVLANDLKEIKEGNHIGYLISKNNDLEHDKIEKIGNIKYPKAESKEEISTLILKVILK